MSAALRPTGIPALGDIAWGTHICNFYQTPQDLIETLVPYFKAGLELNEACLWVTSPPLGVEEARSALAAVAPRLAEEEARGKMEILDYREWYTRTGRFDPDDVLAAWLTREEQARVSGHAGLRVTGNTGWIDDARGFRAFTDYEETLSQTLSDRRALVLCSYPTGGCECTRVFDVVRSHQLALVRRRGDWEVIEDAPLKTAKVALQRLNDELEDRVRLRTAELEQALRARDDFLCLASHELKTPIAALQLQVQGMLRSGRVEGAFAQRLDRTLAHSRRLHALVERLLDVSHVGAGQIAIDVAPCDLREVVRDSLREHEDQLERAGMQVTTRAAGEPTGRWDRQRLGQVMTNLLSNALRHAPGRPLEIDVGVLGAFATLRVRDHGPGIAPRDREIVFQRFVQLGAAPRAGGFGLGLWLVRQIVEAHAGTVEVSGGEGEGAEFVIRLPLLAGVEPAEADA
jgi:signal transduction histidine kinase